MSSKSYTYVCVKGVSSLCFVPIDGSSLGFRCNICLFVLAGYSQATPCLREYSLYLITVIINLIWVAARHDYRRAQVSRAYNMRTAANWNMAVNRFSDITYMGYERDGDTQNVCDTYIITRV